MNKKFESRIIQTYDIQYRMLYIRADPQLENWVKLFSRDQLLGLKFDYKCIPCKKKKKYNKFILTPHFKTAITQKYSELSYLRDIICKITTISIL
jgi:hypothetical protein